MSRTPLPTKLDLTLLLKAGISVASVYGGIRFLSGISDGVDETEGGDWSWWDTLLSVDSVRKTERREARGVKNVGNTCFLGVVLQSLSALPAFKEHILDAVRNFRHATRDERRENRARFGHGMLTEHISTSTALKKIFSKLAKRDVLLPVSPTRLIGSLDCISGFHFGVQNDAHEFLDILVDKIEKELRVMSTWTACGPLEDMSQDETTTALPALGDLMKDVNHFDDRGGKEDALALGLESARGASEPRARAGGKPAGEILGTNLTSLTGIISSTTRCRRCCWKTLRRQKFITLTLPVVGAGANMSLRECLGQYLQGEIIEGVECHGCTLLHALANECSMPQNGKDEGGHSKDKNRTNRIAENAEFVRQRLASVDQEEFISKWRAKINLSHVKIGEENSHEVDLDSVEEKLDDLGVAVKSSIVKTTGIRVMPTNLCIHIARRVMTARGGFKKLRQHIAFEDILRLPHDSSSACVSYKLHSVIVHVGEHWAGHYIAYKRRLRTTPRDDGQHLAKLAAENKRTSACTPRCNRRTMEAAVTATSVWYCCDDASVCPVTWEKVSSLRAYMLFYEKM